MLVADLWDIGLHVLLATVSLGLMTLVVGPEKILELLLALPFMALLVWMSAARK